ncbi:MarR family transcriptional regulator [Glaciihabitans sp. UYNi722]|uniref:MarR family winged helix-turn-helix transcriptional regulator n=1 Tax=Glaciihabitans sp. UYNi722 TaxID=3156344 RepID=UPI003395967D
MSTSDRHVADEAIAGVEQQFAVMFTRVKSSMKERAVRVHPEMQPLAYNMLSSLVRSGPTHASELAELLGLDKSIVSRQANFLEELGFLERQPDPEDRRATYFAATPAAIERIAEVRLADQATLYESLRDWQVPDLKKLGELLARINELGR